VIKTARVLVLNAIGKVSDADTPLSISVVPLPDVESVEPRVLTLGFLPQEVFLYGRYLSTVRLCSFESDSLTLTSPARAVNNTAVACRIPRVEKSAVVRVSANGQQWSFGDSTIILFVPPPIITGFWPELGPEQGGTRVHIVGEFFADTIAMAAPQTMPLALCRFGRLLPTPAVVSRDSASFICSTPVVDTSREPAVFDGVQISISTDSGISWHVSPQTFTFHSAVTVSSVEPSRGPSTGGSIVMVYGGGFIHSSRLSCRFGVEDVAATFVNASAVRCLSPPMRIQSVIVGVSINGVDFSDSSAESFEFYAPVSISGVSPLTTPVRYSTNVTLFGSNFFMPRDAGFLRVFFEDLESPSAGFINSTAIWALTPPSDTLQPFDARIRVSLNGGADWADSSILFPFLATESIISLSPSEVIEDAGADIYVSGNNFVSSNSFLCRFTQIPDLGGVNGPSRGRVDIVSPSWISAPSGVVCRLPPSAKGQVALEVSNNGMAWSSRGPLVSIVPSINIHLIDPIAGPLNGGTAVSLFVVGLVSRVFTQHDLICRFNGTIYVPALRVSAYIVECISPSVASFGFTSLELSVDGGASFSLKSNFSFFPLPTITRVTPNHIKRSTISPLFVYGSGFYNSSAPELDADAPWAFPAISRPLTSGAECVFSVGNDAWTTPAIVFNSTVLQCSSPLLNDMAAVSITLEGQHRTASTILLKASDAASILKVHPSVVSEHGGIRTRLFGSEFVPNPNLACVFLSTRDNSTTATPASFISSSEIDCAPPSLAPGSFTVSVYLSGLRFSGKLC
jgi:hypothetical protein